MQIQRINSPGMRLARPATSLRRVLAAACMVIALAVGLAAQPAGSTFTGKITTDKDVPIAGVRVALIKSGATAVTDANGQFSMRLPAFAPAIPGQAVDTITLTGKDLRDRMIRVTDVGYFKRPFVQKMEARLAAADCPGFTDLMPLKAAIIDDIARLKVEPSHGFTSEQLRGLLNGIASRSTKAPADGEVSFYIWVPKDVPLKAAFLISLHGMGTINSPTLRKFATQHGVALVGVIGDPIQRGCYPLEFMDPFLERLGQMVGHPELVKLPVLTFGHSNGTGFATVYASDRADRLIGWTAYHSGYSWQLVMPGVEKAPGLVMCGQLDELMKDGMDVAVQNLRSQRNAPVAMMLEGNVGHGPVDHEQTWAFVVAFCEAAMRLRLGDPAALRPAVIEQGWLGGLYDRKAGGQQNLPIAPYAEFKGDRSTANWLIDAEFAKVWQAYGLHDPKQPPPPVK